MGDEPCGCIYLQGDKLNTSKKVLELFWNFCESSLSRKIASQITSL
ncbi:hypothetical protein LEP1GSC166_1728 [Leptospira kirschneri]|nr:hypothetical protein LEP1GSC198_2026 [Leptospira kirschneri str. JB]EMK06073.1 hypothetical protein LEP1GSC166_1728 [Leptospira kirschneri]